jgi:uncharacterized membrane protein
MKVFARMCVSAVVISWAAFCMAEQPAAKPTHHRYRLVDLETAGGPNSTLSSQSVAVNVQGTVVGWADTPLADPFKPNCFSDCFVTHAFDWRYGFGRDLGALAPGVSSAALSINQSGLIDGVSENGEIDSLTGYPEVFAVAWKGGNILNLGTLGGNQSAAAGMVSNRGQVVGGALNNIADPLANDFSWSFMFVPAATECHAFLWQNGEMMDLGTLGGPDSIAAFVNDRGQVSGHSYTNSVVNSVTGLPTLHPFLWEN